MPREGLDPDIGTIAYRLQSVCRSFAPAASVNPVAAIRLAWTQRSGETAPPIDQGQERIPRDATGSIFSLRPKRLEKSFGGWLLRWRFG